MEIEIEKYGKENVTLYIEATDEKEVEFVKFIYRLMKGKDNETSEGEC